MSTAARTAFATGAAALSFLALAGSAAASTTTCDRFASPTGDDNAPGTLVQPKRTGQALVNSLAPGETGCLRGGTFAADDQIKISTPKVTLTSYPGERATLAGRLWVAKEAPGTTISSLDLDGRNVRDLPSPTINGDDVVLRGNDITNHHTEICVLVGSSDSWGRAHRTLIEGNRIHACGELPSTNMDHGIYLAASDDAVVRDNMIYDNADRGIQLYPDAQRTLVTGNVINGNGEGVIFSGDETTASSNNVVENNVITNSKIRDNVDSHWPGRVGTGNVLRNNCIGGGAYDDGSGGIIKGSNVGFTTGDNLLKAPVFANALSGDFSLPASNPCASILAGAIAKSPPSHDSDGPQGSGASAVVTIDPVAKAVHTLTPVRVSGRAPGAGRVQVLTRHDGEWKVLGTDRAVKGGGYRLKLRLRNPGRLTLKAVAGGLRDSKPVKLRVKKSGRRG